MQPSKIEWLKNPAAGSKGYSCNPVKGICKTGCKFCYAIRMYKRFKWDPEIRFDHSAFNGLDKLKDGSKVFMGSTHDLFGNWISDEWVHSIILKTVQNPGIVFIFLTKNPKRYSNFDFPQNVWVGYSTTGNLFHKWDERHTDNIKLVSLEPMAEPMRASLEGYAQRMDFDLLIVGAETGNRKERITPKIEWIEEIIKFTRKADIKLFLKNNLQYKQIIQEFPKESRQNEKKVLLTFLKRTREGGYAKVDESSLLYSRLKEQREELYEDEYYYSVR